MSNSGSDDQYRTVYALLVHDKKTGERTHAFGAFAESVINQDDRVYTAHGQTAVITRKVIHTGDYAQWDGAPNPHDSANMWAEWVYMP